MADRLFGITSVSAPCLFHPLEESVSDENPEKRYDKSFHMCDLNPMPNKLSRLFRGAVTFRPNSAMGMRDGDRPRGAPVPRLAAFLVASLLRSLFRRGFPEPRSPGQSTRVGSKGTGCLEECRPFRALCTVISGEHRSPGDVRTAGWRSGRGPKRAARVGTAGAFPSSPLYRLGRLTVPLRNQRTVTRSLQSSVSANSAEFGVESTP